MSTLSKRIGWIVGGTFATLVALIIALPLFIDLNDYKPEISQAVKDATGRDLEIQGDIDLKLFPWIGAEIGAVSLGNAAGFESKEFAHVERVDVKVALLPLFRSEIEARAVIIEGLRVSLEVNADGHNNWQDLTTPAATDPSPATPAAQPAATQPQPASASPALAGFFIGGLQVNNAQLSYRDHGLNSHYEISQLNLNTGPLALDRAIDISLSLAMSSNAPALNAHLQLTTQLTPDLGPQQAHQLNNTGLTLNFDSTEFASKGTLQLNSNILLTLTAEQYQLRDFKLSSSLEHSALPGGKADISLSASDISSDLKAATAHIQALSLSALQLTLTGDVRARDILTEPHLSAQLQTSAFNPRDLFKALAIDAPITANPKALTQAQLSLGVAGTPQQLSLKDIVLTLDQTRLTGHIDVAMPADAALPRLRYQLAIDQLNADDYLPPATEQTETVAATPASAGAAAATSLPLDTLRALDIDGRLSLQQLTISKLHVQQIDTQLHAKDGLIKLSPLKAQLYQGRYNGDMQLDVRQDVARVSVNESLQNIHAGPLLKDFMGEERISGIGDIAFKLTAEGLEPDQILSSLNGDARLALSSGAVRGFSLPFLIRKAKAKIEKQTVPNDEFANQTEFSEMQASIKIRNGVVNNQDLLVKSPFVRISGKGEVNLVTQTIDYLATGVLIKSATGQGGVNIDEVKGLSIPVHVRGTFAEPKFDLQWDEILKQRAKDVLDKTKAELKAKLQAEAAAEKERLRQLAAQKEAELRARAEAEKQRLKQEAEQKKQEAEQQLKEQAEEKLRNFLNR